MPRTPRPLVIALTLSTVSGPVVADMVRDEATGLVVSAPDGYVVQRDAAPPVRFSVRRPADPPSAGCTIDAQLRPAIDDANGGLAHALAERSGQGKTSWQDKALTQIMSTVLVQNSHPYSRNGIEGLQVEGWPRQEADTSGAKVDRNTQVLVALLKIAEGYAKVDCRAEAAVFPVKRSEFEQVVQGVRMSR